MAITTDKNTRYGPPLVSQKYAPLEDIKYVKGDKAYYSALLTNRRNLLVSQNILPRPLTLVTRDWDDVIAAETGHLPPLVVISSNRSQWIAQGINAGELQLQALGLHEFAGPTDLRALTASSSQTVSPPLYSPSRTGGNRNVYIVVHNSEYSTYRKALESLKVTVIGWRFKAPKGGFRDHMLAGFGPSRYAALQFCKELRTAAANAWDYAWLLDDNVVALTNFPGYGPVEGAMAGEPVRVCAGFRGGTKAESSLANRTWARAKVGGAVPPLPASTPPGIVQQAALWNVAYLTTKHLNFGLIYIASAEDLSIVNYFDQQKIPYFFYNGIGVTKELTLTYDNSAGAQVVMQARQANAKRFADAEAGGPAAAAALPPPVQVRPSDGADGDVQTLASFVVNHVLPNSPMSASVGNAIVENDAKCQGVEQITCGAISAGFVTDAALNAAFRATALVDQVVERANAP